MASGTIIWHTGQEYRVFVEAYGFDIITWEGYPQLADMREVAMTTWISKKAAVSPHEANDLALRRSEG